MKIIIYKKIKPKSIFQQIIEDIRTQIVTGKLKPGDILPPERQFAEIIGVSRHSVREALKILEYKGILRSKTGVGTIVNNIGIEILIAQISESSSLSPKNLWLELIELRRAIEPRIAALASARATHEDLDILERIMEELKAEIANNAPRTDADERLHVALAKATKNSTFVRLMDPINSILGEYREASLKIRNRSKEALKEHRKIVQAVKNKNARKAEQAMAYHLDQVEKMIRKMK